MLSIDRNGLTLYDDNVATDIGLAVREDAKVTVIQTVRGDRTVRTYTGLKEAWDYLVDRDSTSETTKNYAGSITAVLDSAGRATWLVLDSKGGTGINQNDEPSTRSISGATFMNIKPTTVADMKAFLAPGAAYTLPENATLKGAGQLNMASNVEDCVFFSFTQKTANSLVTLSINGPRDGLYLETASSVGAGKAVMYVDVLGQPVKHNGSAVGNLAGGVNGANNVTWPSGTYNWTISNADDGILASGTFTINR